MIRLFDHPLSPYAQKVKIALREKGVEFETAVPDGIGVGGAAGQFLAANPRAEVPALIDDDVRIFDSTIILEYIEENWPTPPLLPHGAAERARVRMLEEVMDTHFEAINWGLGEIRFFGRAKGDLAVAIEAKAKAQTESFYRWLETQLGDRDWFNGGAFGWGDLCVVPYVNGSVGHGNPPERGGRLSAWLERVNARSSVAETNAEAVAVRGVMVNVAEMVEQGLFKREYRDHRLEWMIKSGGFEVVAKGLEKDNIRFTGPFG
ncbi:MAG TPA: glutathione S-transferase family protein [Caulobacteraceae bacterium]|jgi:glutathione S-transferase/RNA polymerase-associated protein|nr:glutathione S-transferase family protein [Caulobacteraceae bacterium]